MKKTLKILALIMALALALCVLTACGDKKDETTTDEPAAEEPAAEAVDAAAVDFSQYDLTAPELDWSEGTSNDAAKYTGMLEMGKSIKAGELEGKVVAVSGKLTIKGDATELYQQNGAGGKATVPFQLVEGELPEAGTFMKVVGVVLGDKIIVPADQLTIVE